MLLSPYSSQEENYNIEKDNFMLLDLFLQKTVVKAITH